MAAPFSAIIMVGLLVLPEVIAGMTEASMTRRFSSPPCFSRSAAGNRRAPPRSRDRAGERA